MLASGTIDPANRSFDIAAVQETNTSILTLNNTLRLSYLSESGELIQLVKQLDPVGDNISIGDTLGVSPAMEAGIGGYATRRPSGKIRSLVNIDWNDTSNVVTKTFIDDNGVTRTAVLLPVTLN